MWTMTPLDAILDGTAGPQDLLAFCLLVGTLLGLVIGLGLYLRSAGRWPEERR